MGQAWQEGEHKRAARVGEQQCGNPAASAAEPKATARCATLRHAAPRCASLTWYRRSVGSSKEEVVPAGSSGSRPVGFTAA